MTRITKALAFVTLGFLHHGALAVPTWPSSIDELEDLMYLTTNYRAPTFAINVMPCSFSAQGPGRITAAEWIRTAFHDMATGNTVMGTGGLDASIIFEATNGENQGLGFVSSLTQFAPFLSSRASMADIISVAVYTAVRSCNGPAIPVRAGRVDAVSAGPVGVPLPQNGIGTFRNQFTRIGFNTTEMIAFVACGHALGGVHSTNFPLIVPAGTAPNGFAKFTTSNKFDNTLLNQFIAGTTNDPLVVGPSVARRQNSDFLVFSSDGNATIKAMTDSETFSSRCRAMFQKMIEVVPRGTTLTDPITPYDIKPYDLQLTLQDGGTQILFTGEIRVRTTTRPITQIVSVQLVYKDRNGVVVPTPIDTTQRGTASGFDDSFAFCGFSTLISTDTSISSFNVLITFVGGGTELHDNNGSGFKTDDTIIFQTPQSCVDPSSNTLMVVAALRNGTTPSPTLSLVLKNARPSPIVVPALSTISVAMATQSAVGSYNLYAGTYSLKSLSQAIETSFGIFSGSASDSHKRVSTLTSVCKALDSSPPISTPSSPAYAYQGCYTDNSPNRALTGATYYNTTGMTIQQCSTSCANFQFFGLEYAAECYCGNTQDASSTPAAVVDCNMPCSGNKTETCGAGNRLSLYKNLKYTPIINPNITGYTYQGCYSEPSDRRALAGPQMVDDSLTVESCALFCAGSTYFGVEYARECYCGSTLATNSILQPETDCSFSCAGNTTEYCGAGNRLNVYKNDAFAEPPERPVPHFPGYIYQGCLEDSVTKRILVSKSVEIETNGYEACASFCSGYAYFGLEYGRECYCGNTLTNHTISAVGEEECRIPCPGDPNGNEICGGAHRITLFKTANTTISPKNPDIMGYQYLGCYVDAVESRVLNTSYLFDEGMSVGLCKSFCNGSAFLGVEYGAECYCGEELEREEVVGERECGFLCGGDRGEFCGGMLRVGVYGRVGGK